MKPSERLRRARARILQGYTQEPWSVDRRGDPVDARDEALFSYSLLDAFEADGLGAEMLAALQVLAQVCPWALPRACLRRPEDAHLVEPAVWAWGAMASKTDAVAAIDRAIARAIALERKGNP